MSKTYSTIVEGMTCGNCALTISKLLEKKGATNVSANAASGEVNFTTPETVDVERIYDTIDDMGYHVARAETADKQAGHNHDRSTLYLVICAIFTVPLLLHMFVSWHPL